MALEWQMLVSDLGHVYGAGKHEVRSILVATITQLDNGVVAGRQPYQLNKYSIAFAKVPEL